MLAYPDAVHQHIVVPLPSLICANVALVALRDVFRGWRLLELGNLNNVC